MLIEVFYVPGCPNHQAAIDNLRRVLRSTSITAPIQEVAVTTRQWHVSSSFLVPQPYESTGEM
jgi:hypothetical protein